MFNRGVKVPKDLSRVNLSCLKHTTKSIETFLAWFRLTYKTARNLLGKLIWFKSFIFHKRVKILKDLSRI